MDRLSGFFGELRRRNVFRAGAAYIVLAWLVIQVADILADTFAAPLWVMQFIVYALAAGLPLTLVLAWVYEITTAGIKRTEEASLEESITYVTGRKLDFIIIGVLVVALSLSVYANFRPGPETLEIPDPVSVLIADFENLTGDPIFDGTLEEALRIGVEGASFITAYRRAAALQIANEINSGSILGEVPARLVSLREDIQIVLAGTIEEDNGHYEFVVRVVEPDDGEVIANVQASAKSKLEVLATMGELAAKLREVLGDELLEHESIATKETFTAASLEAAKAYTTAIQFAYEGRHDNAVEEFRKATGLDPNFGRAFSGWALSEFKLGRTEEATSLWGKALSLMETMTERERLRTLGLYYTNVTRNFENAVQSFSELVEKYPADAAGHNNLAVTAFLTLDFARASEEARRLLEIYPTSELYRTNFALYSMYSGDFQSAAKVAQDLVDDNPGYGTAYLPIAIAEVSRGEIEAAKNAYAQMAAADASEHTDSLATLGLADIAVYSGDFTSATGTLSAGIEKDLATDNRPAAAVKQIALAESYIGAGRSELAKNAAEAAMQLSAADTVKVAAARVYLAAGHGERAAEISRDLTAKLQPQSRAYGLMIQASIARESGGHVQAVDLLRSSLELADLWLIRFELGRTYLAEEFYAEALGEFIICQNRHGEAVAVFLDDLPTYRYIVPLYYWLGVAQHELGMKVSAAENLQTYLSLRPGGGVFVDDAKRRLLLAQDPHLADT